MNLYWFFCIVNIVLCFDFKYFVSNCYGYYEFTFNIHTNRYLFLQLIMQFFYSYLIFLQCFHDCFCNFVYVVHNFKLLYAFYIFLFNFIPFKLNAYQVSYCYFSWSTTVTWYKIHTLMRLTGIHLLTIASCAKSSSYTLCTL